MGKNLLWHATFIFWLSFIGWNSASASQSYQYVGRAWGCEGSVSTLDGFCDPADRISGFFPFHLRYSVIDPTKVYQFAYDADIGHFQNLVNLQDLDASFVPILFVRDLIITGCIVMNPYNEDCEKGDYYLSLDLVIEGPSGRAKGRDMQSGGIVDTYFDIAWGHDAGRGVFTEDCCGPCSEQSGTPAHSCSFEFFAVPAPSARESIATAIAFLIAYQARRRYRSWRWSERPGAGAPTLGPCH